MTDDDSTHVGFLHVSVGSATTGAHMSFDFPLADIQLRKAELDKLLDFCLEKTQKCAIARSKLNSMSR